MREASRSVPMQVLRANNAKDKMERSTELLVLRDRIEALLLARRVVREVKAFKSFAGYLHAVEQVETVARTSALFEIDSMCTCIRPKIAV